MDDDTLMREAGEAFDKRRSARARGNIPNYAEVDEVVKTGVSANGKGVKVGGNTKEVEQKVVKKKGKKNVDVVSFHAYS